MDVEAWLNSNGQNIVDAMYLDIEAPEDFHVNTLVRRHDRLVLRVSSRDRSALVKAFNSSPKAGKNRINQELMVQLVLKDTDLIPKIQGYSQQDSWVVSEWISGGMLKQHINAENAQEYARQLGKWCAEYTVKMDEHAVATSSDWFSYLQLYKRYSKRLTFSDYEKFLSKLPINKRVIAKNDPFFNNFLVSKDGQLVGIDFEKAQLKPVGWDVLLTARVFVRKFPHLMIDITDALIDGWGQGTDCIDQSAFLELTRLFAASSAFVLEEEYAVSKAERKND